MRRPTLALLCLALRGRPGGRRRRDRARRARRRLRPRRGPQPVRRVRLRARTGAPTTRSSSTTTRAPRSSGPPRGPRGSCWRPAARRSASAACRASARARRGPAPPTPPSGAARRSRCSRAARRVGTFSRVTVYRPRNVTAAAGAGDDRRDQRALPRQARAAARLGRRGDRGQLARHRLLRQGRGGRRDALLLAPRGAEGPGRGRALLRPRRPPRARACSTTTPTRARRSTAAWPASGAAPTRAVRATARRGAHLRRQGDHRLLLLHLGRPHRERGEHLRRRPAALPGRRGGPLRQHLARATAGASASRARRWTRAWAPRAATAGSA